MANKLCFFTGSQSLPGGTERACADVANSLDNAGYAVTILSQFNGDKSFYKLRGSVGLKELFSARPRGVTGYFKTSFKLLWFVAKNRPDVVIAVESLSFLFMAWCFFLPKRPVLINWEHFNADIDLGVKSRGLARRLAVWLSDKIIVLSDTDKKCWARRLKCPSKKLVRIYNINPTLISGKTNPKDNRCVLAAGRLTHQKGFDLLVEAWSLVPKAQREGWVLRICGEGRDRTFLESMIHKMDISGEVQLAGQVADISTEYERADLFILSSRFEGFGLVVLEALSFGVPVVSFDCPAGPSEIIEAGVDGLLVPPEDIEELAKAIGTIIQDEKKRHAMAKAALRHRPQFSQGVVTDQWVSLLESMGSSS